mmetsp:Transcript_49623/g.56929  ORF Transcript_49623/g.56929 Transcript_49623/m.56929 type:complete len:370 (-) Transcript_49623:137-1246(-)
MNIIENDKTMHLLSRSAERSDANTRAQSTPSPSPSQDSDDGQGAQNLKGITYMLISQLFLYITTVIVKELKENYGIPSSQVLVFRGLITTLGAGLVIHFQKISWGPQKHRIDIIFRGICGSMAGGFLYLSSAQGGDLAVTYTIYYASPFISAILGAWFLKERLNVCEIFSIALGFTGVIFTLEPAFIFGESGDDSAKSYAPLVLLVPFLAAVTASIGYFFNRRAKGVSYQVLLLAVGIGFTVYGTICLCLFEKPTAFVWASFLLTILAGILGYAVELFLNRGLQLEKLGVSVGTKFALIIFSHVGDVFIFGIDFSIWHLVGVVIIFVSVVSMVTQKRRAIAKLRHQANQKRVVEVEAQSNQESGISAQA